jgi:hypothetical protein
MNLHWKPETHVSRETPPDRVIVVIICQEKQVADVEAKKQIGGRHRKRNANGKGQGEKRGRA